MEKNVFKQIEPQAKLPKKMKKDVLDSIEAIKLAKDFWDLLATKRVQMNLNVASQMDMNNNPKLEEE
ncbi:MAG: hypothetical protein RLZZ337_1681 [Bacteroidota bacterium]|jgi:hypothetical protein